MAQNPFLKRLSSGLIIAEGYFLPGDRNLSHPGEVQKTHLESIKAGAEIIRTNTARAGNDYKMNISGTKIAKYARDISGKPVFIAGNVSPAKKACLEGQIKILIEGGVDLLLFEGFSDFLELKKAINLAQAFCDLPLVLGFNLKDLKQIKNLSARVRKFSSLPLGVFIDKSLFPDLKKVIKELQVNNIKIIGGGQDTRAKDIKKIREVISPQRDPEVLNEPTLLYKKFAKKEFVLSVEIDPPKGVNPQKDIEGAFMLKECGADLINVGDSPMARIRMDAKDFCWLIQNKVGLETILHFTTRDRNLMKIQADLLGAQVLGIRNILALTGDPPKVGNCPEASTVYDIHSTQLVDLIKNKLNRGVDWHGNPLGGRTDLFVAVALDLAVSDGDMKWQYFAQKVKAGADAALTQPIFEKEPLLKYLDLTQGKPPIPLILGILPLQSERQAIFLNNNVEGIEVPEIIIERLKKAGRYAKDEGITQAQELVLEVKDLVSGIYIIPSFGRYEVAAEVARVVKK